jgi:hypothetical protein
VPKKNQLFWNVTEVKGEPAPFFFQDPALHPEDKGNTLLRHDSYLRGLVASMAEFYRNEFTCSE